MVRRRYQPSVVVASRRTSEAKRYEGSEGQMGIEARTPPHSHVLSLFSPPGGKSRWLAKEPEGTGTMLDNTGG
jgi:hypothetical protein